MYQNARNDQTSPTEAFWLAASLLFLGVPAALVLLGFAAGFLGLLRRIGGGLGGLLGSEADSALLLRRTRVGRGEGYITLPAS